MPDTPVKLYPHWGGRFQRGCLFPSRWHSVSCLIDLCWVRASGDKPTLRMNAVDSQYETVQHRIRSLADAIVSIKQKLASTEQAENGARVDSGSESDSESESLHEECQKGNHLNGREHSLLHSQAPGKHCYQHFWAARLSTSSVEPILQCCLDLLLACTFVGLVVVVTRVCNNSLESSLSSSRIAQQGQRQHVRLRALLLTLMRTDLRDTQHLSRCRAAPHVA